jgi:hypothetical protein
LSLLTSIPLPASVDLIGEECVYGRHLLDAHALERNQVTRFVHRKRKEQTCNRRNFDQVFYMPMTHRTIGIFMIWQTQRRRQ